MSKAKTGSTPPPTISSELKSLVGLDAADEQALARVKPLVEPNFETIAEAFYARLREQEQVQVYFRDADQVARHRRVLVEWMARLFAGPHDERSFEDAVRIGRKHAEVALPQRYVVCAMTLVRVELDRAIGVALGEGAGPTRTALSRALDLDLAAMLESHQRESLARLERRERERKLAAVGTLAAGLAHEIRNPLNGAQLHIAFLDRVLRKGDRDPEMLEAVHVAADEITRLAALVSEFLEFARPKPLELRRVSAAAIVQKTVELSQAKAKAAGAEIVVELPAHEIEVNADPVKLEQVLVNLVSNAIEAVEAVRGGTVTLRLKQKPPDVVFEVEDDGPGLPSADAPIFDAFYSTKPKGTGLGLSISHQVVADHGGEIGVELHPGRTIFRFAIPL